MVVGSSLSDYAGQLLTRVKCLAVLH